MLEMTLVPAGFYDIPARDVDPGGARTNEGPQGFTKDNGRVGDHRG